jgi:bacillithiol system protein YtxJ
MNWKSLESIEQLEEICKKPTPSLIFKHSTRCSISSTALDRLQRQWSEQEMAETDAYYLDLIRFRDVSNKIAQVFGVEHQSPQVLLIMNGKCVYHESHYGIRYDILKDLVSSYQQ